ncbi:MAG TPA: hypothetical protein VGJ95_07150 [Pseudonocardiaceae bacterium]
MSARPTSSSISAAAARPWPYSEAKVSSCSRAVGFSKNESTAIRSPYLLRRPSTTIVSATVPAPATMVARPCATVRRDRRR